MMDLELPSHQARNYLLAYGVVAVYIATPPGGRPCMIGTSHDLTQSSSYIKRAWSPVVDITRAWWVQTKEEAEALERAVISVWWEQRINATRLDITGEQALNTITRIAFEKGITIHDHDDVMSKANSAVRKVTEEINHAQATGGLKWFNRAYKAYRLACKAAGENVMPYDYVIVRLISVLVGRVARREVYKLDASLLDEVFVPKKAKKIGAVHRTVQQAVYSGVDER